MVDKFKELRAISVDGKNLCLVLSEIISSEKQIQEKYSKLYDSTFAYSDSEMFKDFERQHKSHSIRMKNLLKRLNCEL